MQLETYLQHRRWFEAAFGLVLVTLISVINATTIVLEGSSPPGAPAAHPWIMEFSSGFAVLCLLPAVLWCALRLRPALDRPTPALFGHALVFVLFVIAHLALMGWFRSIGFAMIDYDYDRVWSFGRSLLYEGRKDLLVYLLIISTVYAYEFILSRLRGEANFLSTNPVEPSGVTDSAEAAYKSQFLVKMLNREFLVKVDDIDWIQSARNYVLLKCGAREYPMRKTMAALQAQLDATQFVRVHRTAFVNLNKIAAIEELTGGECQIKLHTGITVPVSRPHRESLREAWSQGEVRSSPKPALLSQG